MKTLLVIIVVAVVLAGGYFLLRKPYRPAAPLPPSSRRQIAPQPAAGQTPTQEKLVVTYTDVGYSPKTLRIKKGETVTFKNESSRSLWTASGVHPTHRLYSGTSLDKHCPDTSGTAFDACTGVVPGGAWSFTFAKTGTWNYHNHLNPSDIGTIAVE